MDLGKHFALRFPRGATPQREPIPEAGQVPNSAGGFVWPVDRWTRLDRFLVLGSEGGTYYVAERPLSIENARSVVECVALDGPRVVQRALEVSVGGRAAKNDPALFVLAIAAGLGDAKTKAAVWTALLKVARTATHLFHWLQYVKRFRGWGRGVRRAVARWYTEQTPAALAYQVLKYPGRDGWTHRDVLRLSHPKAPTVGHDLMFRYAIRGWEGVLALDGVGDHEVVQHIESVQALRYQAPPDAARTIVRHALTREMVPTELLRHAVVWEALLEQMPFTALLRNLAVLSKVGLLVPMAECISRITERLTDHAALRAARVHPLALLAALKTYAQGHGHRGRGAWSPVPQVVDALDTAFYLAFDNAPATSRRIMLALDVSGSMTAAVHGVSAVSCREAAAAMALVTAAREPRHMFTAFTAGSWISAFTRKGDGISTLSISSRERLDDVVRRMAGMSFGATDCALPMLEAVRQRWPIDLFVVYTDNETWAGDMHPAEALRRYRDKMGIPAKLVVVGMASNGFTIADPADAGMLDVVGFDPGTPQVIADFGNGGAGGVGAVA